MLARRVRVDVPAEVERLVVETPVQHSATSLETVVYRGERVGRLSPNRDCAECEAFAVRGHRTIDLSLVRSDSIDPSSISSPPWRPRPVLRRLVTETRDRLQPLRSQR
jgi:hypothetical protein